eukprot:SM004873S16485  [mRNA]  locus=s4873:16:1090:+ [translate_table: standard]
MGKEDPDLALAQPSAAEPKAQRRLLEEDSDGRDFGGAAARLEEGLEEDRLARPNGGGKGVVLALSPARPGVTVLGSNPSDAAMGDGGAPNSNGSGGGGGVGAALAPPWMAAEDKAFEVALAAVPPGEAGRWAKLAARLPGRTPDELRRHYDLLVEDIRRIEAGRIAVPNYAGMAGSGGAHTMDVMAETNG